MQNSVIIPFLQGVYGELKFWIAIGGVVWSVFKGLQWVKELKTKDLAEIKSDVSLVKQALHDQTQTLQTSFEKQTNAVVGELKELRQDFRSYLAPIPSRKLGAKAGLKRKTR